MVFFIVDGCTRIVLVYMVFLFLPTSFSGFRRPFRGYSAFFGWLSFAAASAFSLLPPAEGRCHHRPAVIIVHFVAIPNVDKIAPIVDFCCKFADFFVTLYYI